MRRQISDRVWAFALGRACIERGFVLLLACLFCSRDSRSLADDAAKSTPTDAAYNEQIRPLLQKYCFECHGEKTAKNGLRLDTLSADFLSASAPVVWKDVLSRVVDSGESRMPPEGKPRPSEQEVQTLRDWIASKFAATVAADAVAQKSEGRAQLR